MISRIANRPKLVGRREWSISALAICCLTFGLALAQDIPVGAAGLETVITNFQGSALSLPTDLAIGSKGTLYVVDSGRHRVVAFDQAGRGIMAFGSEGSGPGQLQNPVGIAIGPDQNIYVADRGNYRLQVFSPTGEFMRSIVLNENDAPVTPVDVTVSGDGTELFVTANNSHRVLVFSPSGALLRGWGGKGSEPGQFMYPASIVQSPTGALLVVDALNQRVQSFSTRGDFQKSFGQLGAKPGSLFRPKGITVDQLGRVYVSDSYLGAIQVFEPDGKFLHVLGRDGAPLHFATPTGVVVRENRLYVVGMLPGSVSVLDLGAGT